MLEYQQPLDSAAEARGGLLTDRTGIRVKLAETGILLLQSSPSSALQDAVTSETALRLPGPGETSVRGDYALLWLTPAEWLLECPMQDTGSLRSALTRRLATSLAVVTDMSGAFACFELDGDRTHDILMSGCSLDLRAESFPAGRAARTSLAGIPAIIRTTAEPHGFRCLVDRSYARHLRNWLLRTAAW